jgi:hypothetical protein
MIYNFHISRKALQALSKAQREMGIPQNKLTLDVTKRWFYTGMLRSVSKSRKAINATVWKRILEKN